MPEIEPSSRRFGSHQFHYIDVEQIVEVHPDVVLIDELAHTNISKKRHLKRYMDIEEILSHGIDVWTTLNIQHIESLSGQIALMTGIKSQSVYQINLLCLQMRTKSWIFHRIC